MEDQEPGYWVRWAAGIVAAVVGGVLVAVLAGVFDDNPPGAPSPTPTPTPGARVHIAQFSLASRGVGEYPKATFTVSNEGEETARRCHLEWHTESPIVGDPEAQFSDELVGEAIFSDEFAVKPEASHTEALYGSERYSAGLKPSTAKVECSNATSGAEADAVIVGVPPFSWTPER